MRASTIDCRLLTRREECEAVVALEREIWGPHYDEAIPVALLLVSQSRGGILIGAFDERDRMIGFVYSIAAFAQGRPSQWSYKLGVLESHRNSTVGEQLKLHQRQRAIEMGLDLIEWTFDPLLAANAHLNLTKLGAVVTQYHDNLYGPSLAPIAWRAIPSDRVIAAWHLREAAPRQRDTIDRGAIDLDDIRAVNQPRREGEWLACGSSSLDLDADRLKVEIPLGFGDMVRAAPGLAMEWRLALRRIFTAYFAAGYAANGFCFDHARQRGAYLLVKPGAAARDTVAAPALGASAGRWP